MIRKAPKQNMMKPWPASPNMMANRNGKVMMVYRAVNKMANRKRKVMTVYKAVTQNDKQESKSNGGQGCKENMKKFNQTEHGKNRKVKKVKDQNIRKVEKYTYFMCCFILHN